MKPHLFFSCFLHTSQILHVVNKFGSDHVITYLVIIQHSHAFSFDRSHSGGILSILLPYSKLFDFGDLFYRYAQPICHLLAYLSPLLCIFWPIDIEFNDRIFGSYWG